MSSVDFDWYGAPGADGVASRVVEKTVLDLEGNTKARIVAVDAVDTGHMLGGVNSKMTGDLEGEVRVPAPYSVFVHEGHRIVAWGHDTGRYEPGRPFLRGPLDEIAPAFLDALRRAFN